MKKVCILFILKIFSVATCEVVTLNDNTVINNTPQQKNSKQSESDNESDNDKRKDEQHSFVRPNAVAQKQITVHAILDLILGDRRYDNNAERIDIYVAPSCLHCGTFLVKDLQDFLDQHFQSCCIRIRLLPVSAKDLFVMKIIQGEAKDMNGYYMIYLNYVRRTLATIKDVQPTERQRALYKGSTTDPEMIKYQAVASAFGFSDEKIVTAIPNMDGYYEKAVMNWYRNIVKILEPFCPNKKLDLPLIIQNGKSYKSINDVPVSG